MKTLFTNSENSCTSVRNKSKQLEQYFYCTNISVVCPSGAVVKFHYSRTIKNDDSFRLDRNSNTAHGAGIATVTSRKFFFVLPPLKTVSSIEAFAYSLALTIYSSSGMKRPYSYIGNLMLTTFARTSFFQPRRRHI